jgi:PTS system N-acetylgalactosamine-specific IIA component
MSSRESGSVRAPRALVAGHGDFAVGLVSAVQQITGRGGMFRTISARDLSGSDLEKLIRATIEEIDAHVVFTDLQAGSCTIAARRVLRDRQDVLLVGGANLPMLLDFVFADDLPPMEAARHALDRGRAAITAVGGTPTNPSGGRPKGDGA